MRPDHRTYTSARAMEVFEQIEKILHERGTATTIDLAKVTALSQNRVGEFLREMRKKGTAVCVRQACKTQGGSTPAHWGPGTRSADFDEQDDAPRVVVVRKDWAPSLMCDPFHLPQNFFARTTP